MSPILVTACERAWAALTADLTLSPIDAAQQQGVHPQSLRNWIAKRHPGELQALRSKAGLGLTVRQQTPEEAVITPEKRKRLRAALKGLRSGKYVSAFVAAKNHDVTSSEFWRFLQLPENQPRRNPAELPLKQKAVA